MREAVSTFVRGIYGIRRIGSVLLAAQTSFAVPVSATEVLAAPASAGNLRRAAALGGTVALPPGTHRIEEAIEFVTPEPVLVMGSGRGQADTTLFFTSAGRLVVRRCSDLDFAQLRILATDARSTSVIEIGAGTPCRVRLTDVVFEGPRLGRADRATKAVAVMLAGASRLYLQATHVTDFDVGVNVAHRAAAAVVMGGNYLNNRIHLRHDTGSMTVFGTGFQRATGGADLELHDTLALPVVLAGSRSEGPGALVRVAGVSRPAVVLVANSVPVAEVLVDGAEAGSLRLLGNVVPKGRPTARAAGSVLSLANRWARASPVGSRGRSWLQADLADRDDGRDQEPVNQHADGGEWPADPAGRAAAGAVRLPTVPAVVAGAADLAPIAVSVRAYGAEGDGAADDTAAIQRAVSDPSARVLHFPAGRYRLTSPIHLDHKHGGVWIGDGMDASVLLDVTGQGVVRSDGCGYATFQDLGFESPAGGSAPVFDLSWDRRRTEARGLRYGAALQANSFRRCRFRGGAVGLYVGREGYMGSESWIAGCRFEDSGIGLALGNFNALTNNVVACRFRGHRVAIAQKDAGSVNVLSSRFEASAEADLELRNSAGDAFYVGNSASRSRRLLLSPNTGAAIHVTMDAVDHSPSAAGEHPDRAALDYGAGGAVLVRDSRLRGGPLHAFGAIAHKLIVLLASPARLRLDDRAAARTADRAHAADREPD